MFLTTNINYDRMAISMLVTDFCNSLRMIKIVTNITVAKLLQYIMLYLIYCLLTRIELNQFFIRTKIIMLMLP